VHLVTSPATGASERYIWTWVGGKTASRMTPAFTIVRAQSNAYWSDPKRGKSRDLLN
jgi:hypothetical protein